MSPPHRIVLRWVPLALGRSELAREIVLTAPPYLYDAALEAPQTSGFALLGDSLFSNAGRPAPKKVSKNACSCTGLGVPGSLRSTSLIPSSFRGPAYKGHPYQWRPRPFTPLAASMPLAPLHENSIRPSERGVRCRLVDRTHGYKQSDLLLPLFRNFQTTRTKFPFRRPNVGAAQGDARHGCRARSDGTWMSLRDDPRSGAGAREVLRSKTRMLGWPSFWLLFLGHSRKRDSPSRAKPLPQPSTINSRDHHPRRQKLREQARSYESPLRNVRGNREVGPRPLPIKKTLSVCA